MAGGKTGEQDAAKKRAHARREVEELREARESCVSAEKRIERLLREWQMTFDAIGDPISIHDKEFRILRVNKAYADAMGMRREDLEGKFCYEIVHAKKEPWLNCALVQAMEKRERATTEFFEPHLGIYFEITASPIFGAAGRFEGVVHVMKNVTERKRAQEQLLELSRAVEQSPSVVVITNTKGEIEYVNPKFTQLTGYAPDEVIGKNSRFLKSGEMPQEEYRRLWETIASGNEWRGEFHNRKKSGELYWEFASISPIRDAKGATTHYLAVKEDITKRKQLERIKDEFVNTVSHEMRTPLTTVREGVSQVLDGILGETTAKQREFLSIVLSDIDRLKRIIDSLLDISKIESGKMEIRREPVDMVSLVRDAVAVFDPHARTRGLELAAHFSREQIEVFADRDKVVQILANLIDNAIKFTEKGRIDISVSDTGNAVEISIADTGKGIAEEDLPHVFSKFQQFGRLAGPGERGTGLGLSIAKGIVELHRGKIWVTSALRKGSTFTVVLPKDTIRETIEEHAFIALEEARKNGKELAFLLFRVKGFEDLRRQIGGMRAASLLHSIESLVKATLRRQADRTFLTDRFVAAVLVGTSEKDTSSIAEKVIAGFSYRVSVEGREVPVELLYAQAHYPKDGTTCEEVLKALEREF